jgi:hypothetical protein
MTVTLAALTGQAMPASAGSLTGHKFLQVRGSTAFPSSKVDVPDNTGSLTLTGIIEFNGDGGAKFVAITLFYLGLIDSGNSILCKLNSPADVTNEFDEKSGVGTFKVTIGKNDACIEADSGKPATNFGDEHFYDRGITFDLYHVAGSSRLVSTESGILDNGGNVINLVNLQGSLDPVR